MEIAHTCICVINMFIIYLALYVFDIFKVNNIRKGVDIKESESKYGK